jgi:folate-binding protein YgfZ
LRRSPIFAAHLTRGAEMATVDGWLLPQHYGADNTAEIEALLTGAALIDMAHTPTVSWVGPDARRFCNGMFTNNVRDLTPGEGNRSAAANDRGRIQCLLDIYCTADDAFFGVIEGATADWFSERYGMYIVFDDVEMTPSDEGPWVLSVQGPQAAAVLAAAGLPVPETGHLQVGDGIRVCCKDRAGTGGYDLIVPAEALDTCFEALASSGATPTGLQALDSVRIAHGRAAWPQDGTEKSLVHELGLNSEVCSFTKGCYLGQEVINRVDVKGGVTKRLTGLLLAEDALPPAGAEVMLESKIIGSISSAARFKGQAIALAVLRKSAWEPGTEVSIQAGERTVLAQVTALPQGT